MELYSSLALGSVLNVQDRVSEEKGASPYGVNVGIPPFCTGFLPAAENRLRHVWRGVLTGRSSPKGVKSEALKVSSERLGTIRRVQRQRELTETRRVDSGTKVGLSDPVAESGMPRSTDKKLPGG